MVKFLWLLKIHYEANNEKARVSHAFAVSEFFLMFQGSSTLLQPFLPHENDHWIDTTVKMITSSLEIAIKVSCKVSMSTYVANNKTKTPHPTFSVLHTEKLFTPRCSSVIYLEYLHKSHQHDTYAHDCEFISRFPL